MSIMPSNPKGGVDARQQMLLAQRTETSKPQTACRNQHPHQTKRANLVKHSKTPLFSAALLLKRHHHHLRDENK